MTSFLALSLPQISPTLYRFTNLGAEWVLWLLILLSIISVAIIIERGVYFYGVRCNLQLLIDDLRKMLRKKDYDAAISYCRADRSLESKMILAGLLERDRGVDAVASAFRSEKSKLKLLFDKNLSMLAAIGANAAFVGLFGTALGIIQAFRKLSESQGKAGANAYELIVGNVSEALVATAIGIMVAVPAVVAYNLYGRSVKRHLTAMDAVAESTVSELQSLSMETKK